MNYEAFSVKYNFHSIRFVNFLRRIRPSWFMRPMFKFIKDNYNHPLVGVEIGTSKGYNAHIILTQLNIKQLVLIDPQPDLFKSKWRKCVLMIAKSKDVVNDITDNLDFVYIDGDHSYEAVKQDIELYYPKIKKGGVIGGHDIRFDPVFNAVKNKFLKFQMHLNDWWVVKGDQK